MKSLVFTVKSSTKDDLMNRKTDASFT